MAHRTRAAVVAAAMCCAAAVQASPTPWLSDTNNELATVDVPTGAVW